MLKLAVSGMTCQHCVTAITRAVQGIPAVDGVVVDLAHGEVTVQGSPDPAAVRQAIAEEGYEVA
jgi:copper chaperone